MHHKHTMTNIDVRCVGRLDYSVGLTVKKPQRAGRSVGRCQSLTHSLTVTHCHSFIHSFTHSLITVSPHCEL